MSERECVRAFTCACAHVCAALSYLRSDWCLLYRGVKTDSSSYPNPPVALGENRRPVDREYQEQEKPINCIDVLVLGQPQSPKARKPDVMVNLGVHLWLRDIGMDWRFGLVRIV